MSKQRLLLATRNAHKTCEVCEILGEDFIVEDLGVMSDFPEVEETGETFEENACLKAVAASLVYDGWVLADDSGLEVDALDGAPGVRSARFAGDNATMDENRALLVAKMASVAPDARGARFRCVLALARGGKVEEIVSGAVEGVLVEKERGEGGFGYDPLFVPEGEARTFSEMSAGEKHAMSHRGRALKMMAKKLRTL